jgi:predicted AlkP superfamily phosphohydrolase/phosphomutase
MQTLILGFDAFDPTFFENLSEHGKLPNLNRYAKAGGYAPFAVSNPPQSEVSWTSIATGLNPGGHGIFDFVHRDPATYALMVSLLPTKQGIAGTQFVPPFQARTIFDQAAGQGYPATALWWPAMFPARPESPVRTIPGLGTPDIQGRLGVGTLFTTTADTIEQEHKTAVVVLEERGTGRYVGVLEGPLRKTRKGTQSSGVKLQLELVGDRTARLAIGKQAYELVEGEWSPIVEVAFSMGRLMSVRAITRVILSRLEPDVKLYFLPLQIHPLRSAWRYASPRGFVKKTWTTCGPFLTLGWPQDTTALEEGCITDDQFLDLCDQIFRARESVLMHHLHDFREGILASVFDSLDRIQHMFWRDRPDVIEAWYFKLDSLLGRVEERLSQLGQDEARVVVVSDHGFANLDFHVDLNRWLVEKGYLVTKPDSQAGTLKGVDWSRSQAYALGLNSLYLNIEGREGQGSVPANQIEPLFNKLKGDLSAWHGPDGREVVRLVAPQSEAFQGPLAEHGPDIVVGYAPGYRASSRTGLGMWEQVSIEPNTDHWGSDHCMDPRTVPGVVFANQGLQNFPQPSYRDFPALTIEAEPELSDSLPPVPPPTSDEDEAIIEERLRGLGYL